MADLYFFEKPQYLELKSNYEEQGFELISMSKLLSNQAIENLDRTINYCIDISSAVAFLKANEAQLMIFEQLFDALRGDFAFICDKCYENDVKYLFRYVFSNFYYVDVEIEDKPILIGDEENANVNVKRITDLSLDSLDSFFYCFNSRIYGHDKFKEEFLSLVHSFRVFNRLGEHKILSLFLMGDSGVGKTEVARAIHKSLNGKGKLAKINFGNYSSHDALNSLIGSPLGYIGSDGGELFKRVNQSDTGLILIDEFEKANNAVFNYFLDVLESGKIVNSQAEEYNANGYIFVFTSNMSKEDFMTKISPELRSRFDYKGIFNLLSDEDKKKFVHFRINQIIEKYTELVRPDDIPKDLHEDIFSEIDVSQYKNMRDLNKRIKDLFVSRIKV